MAAALTGQYMRRRDSFNNLWRLIAVRRPENLADASKRSITVPDSVQQSSIVVRMSSVDRRATSGSVRPLG